METLSKKEFLKKYKCKSCLYYSKVSKCIAEGKCPLDINIEIAKRRTCPLDEEGTCPYRNEIGTCFGFCLKQLMTKMNERKKQDEQSEEDKKDDG